MRVLLTGATGFLGGYLIEKLKKEKCEIVAIARSSSVLKNLNDGSVNFLFGDLKDEAFLKSAVKGVDVVIHAAATMRGDWDEYNRVNVKSTELLLNEVAKTKGKKFIFISSVIVYEHSTSEPEQNFDEDMGYEANDLTNYSRSKIEAEKVVKKFRKEKNANAYVIRPGALYGPGGQLYPARLGFALGSSKYLVIGDGNNQIPLTHVRSVADAAWRIISADKIESAYFNIIEDSNITQNQYLDLIKQNAIPKLKALKLSYKSGHFLASFIGKTLGLLKQKSPIRLPYLRLCANQYFYSTEKARKELGWKPQSDVVETIKEVLTEYVDKRKPKRNLPILKGKVQIDSTNTLKVGIVGCGMFADTHLGIIKKIKNAEVVAICDLNQTAAEETATKFGIRGKYSDINEMLEKEKLDVVHIVTSGQSHLALALAAIKKKVNVLVEKPFALNADQAKQIFQAAEKNKVKVCVDHNHLFDEVMIRTRELLAQGAVGKVCYVESWYATSYSSNSGNRYLSYDAKDHWVYQLPGSLYQNMISHPISLLTDVIGKTKNIQPVAKYMHIVPHMKNDELRVLVEGEDAIGEVHLSFSVTPRYHFLNIYGTKGTLKVDFLNKYIYHEKAIPMIPKVIVRNIQLFSQAFAAMGAVFKNLFRIVTGKYSLFEGNERLIQLFYRSILHGEPTPVTKEETIHSMEIMDEIWQKVDGMPAQKSGVAKTNGIANGKVTRPKARRTVKK